jgi:hypothetical protein
MPEMQPGEQSDEWTIPAGRHGGQTPFTLRKQSDGSWELAFVVHEGAFDRRHRYDCPVRPTVQEIAGLLEAAELVAFGWERGDPDAIHDGTDSKDRILRSMDENSEGAEQE